MGILHMNFLKIVNNCILLIYMRRYVLQAKMVLLFPGSIFKCLKNNKHAHKVKEGIISLAEYARVIV